MSLRTYGSVISTYRRKCVYVSLYNCIVLNYIQVVVGNLLVNQVIQRLLSLQLSLSFCLFVFVWNLSEVFIYFMTVKLIVFVNDYILYIRYYLLSNKPLKNPSHSHRHDHWMYNFLHWCFLHNKRSKRIQRFRQSLTIPNIFQSIEVDYSLVVIL